jgi:CBS domain-containing protein
MTTTQHDHRRSERALEPDRVRVRDLMTSPVVAIFEGDSAWTAMERFVVAGTRHLVVVTRDGRCVGVLANHHVAALWPLDPLGLRRHIVRDMLEPGVPPTLHASATVGDAARVMVRHGVDAVIILGDDDEIVGVLTGGDIVGLVAGRRVTARNSGADS